MKETPPPSKSPEDKAAVPAGPAIAKPVPKVAKKPAKPKDPLVDNNDGTITDPNSGLIWKKSDAWLDTKRFYTWPSHMEYVDRINKDKFAGYDDWRIPSKAEALTLFDKTKKCLDKNGSVFFVDPVFTAGGAGNTWICESSDDKITRYDWKTGVDTSYGTAEIWASMRLVRKPE